MNDLSTVQLLIHNDPPLLLKLVVLKRFLSLFLNNEASNPVHQLFQTSSLMSQMTERRRDLL